VFEVTLTLVQPTSGRIGPGTLFISHTDLVGPIVPGTRLYITIREVSSGDDLIGGNTLVTSVNQSGYFGAPANIYNLANGLHGVADNTPVLINTVWFVPGSGFIDNTDFTGFYWDPVSQLWFCNWLNIIAYAGTGSTVSTKIDQILASVKHTYTC